MGRKCSQYFALYYIAIALVNWCGLALARQADSAAFGRHRKLILQRASTAFLLPNSLNPRFNWWKCQDIPTERVVCEPYIKDIPYYNQFPSFVEGKFSFTKVDVDPKALGNGNPINADVISAIDAIDRITHFRLQKNGNLHVTMRTDVAEQGDSTRQANTETSMSNFTIGIIKQMYEQDPGVDEWMQHLKQKEFNVPAIADIIEDTGEIRAKHQRNEVTAILKNIIRECDIKQSHLEPIGWKYIPSQKLVEVLVRLTPIAKVVMWIFKLLPGYKPLMIHEARIKISNDATKDYARQKNKVFAQCVMTTYNNTRFRIRRLVDVDTTTNTRSNKDLPTDYCSTDTTMQHNGDSKPLDRKGQLVEISGAGKIRINMLIKLMRIVAENMDTKDTKYVAGAQKPTMQGDPYPQPFFVQKLHIIVNGKYYKFLPLLVFYVETTQTYHLCTREIQVQPREKHSLWNPWNRKYMNINIEHVPHMYIWAMFAETRHFQITKQNIQSLLALYKPLQHLDIQGYYSGTSDSQRERVKNIIHIDETRQYMVNIVT
ncbi:hypothetical protein X943_001722 [Babesia divergens]|uniref:Uncharacterized protein n=1 Tax=Babesia divergens TaxID=32595 RepID=A0AAD9GHH0_BABDI|nr:hypothetical protein X943_001722 [Babesia divergens]